MTPDPDKMKAALERLGNYDVYFEDKADAVRHLNAMIRIAREAVYGEADRGPTKVVSIDDAGNPILVDHLPPKTFREQMADLGRLTIEGMKSQRIAALVGERDALAARVKELEEKIR